MKQKSFFEHNYGGSVASQMIFQLWLNYGIAVPFTPCQVSFFCPLSPHLFLCSTLRPLFPRPQTILKQVFVHLMPFLAVFLSVHVRAHTPTHLQQSVPRWPTHTQGDGWVMTMDCFIIPPPTDWQGAYTELPFNRLKAERRKGTPPHTGTSSAFPSRVFQNKQAFTLIELQKVFATSRIAVIFFSVLSCSTSKDLSQTWRHDNPFPVISSDHHHRSDCPSWHSRDADQ